MATKTKEKVKESSLAKVVSRMIDDKKWHDARELLEKLYIEDKKITSAESDEMKELLEKIISYFVEQKSLGYAKKVASIGGRKLTKDEVLPEIKKYFKIIKTDEYATKYMFEWFPELDDYELELKYLRSILKIIIRMEKKYNAEQHEVSYEMRYNFFKFIFCDRYNNFLDETFSALLEEGLYGEIEDKILDKIEDKNKAKKYKNEMYKHFKKKRLYHKQIEYAEMLGINISNNDLEKIINDTILTDKKFALDLLENLPLDIKIRQISNLEKIYEKTFYNDRSDYEYVYWLRSYIDELIEEKAKLEANCK